MLSGKYYGHEIFSSSRSTCTNNDNLPRQQKHDIASRKRKNPQVQENLPYKRMLLLGSRQINKGGQSSRLPYDEHTFRLLYETTTGQNIQKNEKNHSKYA